MKYLVWCRKLRGDNVWNTLPYAPRCRESAIALRNYYQQRWAGVYEYEIHPADRYSRPKGMCVPFSY